tara:strand:- start:167 stop:688 length:522 start_codon:yes stop_codon:yes gene_type:complete
MTESTEGSKVWTVKVGIAPITPFGFRRAIRTDGTQINWLAHNVIRVMPVAQREAELDLVAVPFKEVVGNNTMPSLLDFFRGIGELGLLPCPAEAAVRFCKEYGDQPLGEKLAVGMDPILIGIGFPVILGISRDRSGRRLDGATISNALEVMVRGAFSVPEYDIKVLLVRPKSM